MKNMKNLIILIAIASVTACVPKPEPKANLITDEYGEVHVQSPACPDWTGGVDENGGATLRNFETQHSHNNYSCATMTNFGKMISDPMDMVTGKSTDYYDGQITANAVRTNRNSAAQ